jgi:hypothetical protein
MAARPNLEPAMKQHVRFSKAALVAAGVVFVAAASAEEKISGVAVDKTAFRITLEDGRVLTGDDLVGVTLTVGDANGVDEEVRIDAVETDPKDPLGEVTLYSLSVADAISGEWKNLCGPDPDGRQLAFPLGGTWTATGEHLPSDTAFSITCTSGTVGKCVRAGYKPWAKAPDGTPLWDHHQACVRMFRADYCGDGRPHTRDGTTIDLYDRLGIQRDEPEPGMSFEAAWGPEGALCLAHTRIPEIATREDVLAACPRLQQIAAADCSEAAPGALLFNKSF